MLRDCSRMVDALIAERDRYKLAVARVGALIEANGCDCACECVDIHVDGHDDDCDERCLAHLVSAVVSNV